MQLSKITQHSHASVRDFKLYVIQNLHRRSWTHSNRALRRIWYYFLRLDIWYRIRWPLQPWHHSRVCSLS
jgi:hypothetical protein